MNQFFVFKYIRFIYVNNFSHHTLAESITSRPGSKTRKWYFHHTQVESATFSAGVLIVKNRAEGSGGNLHEI